jgi:hypothetical protein
MTIRCATGTSSPVRSAATKQSASGQGLEAATTTLAGTKRKDRAVIRGAGSDLARDRRHARVRRSRAWSAPWVATAACPTHAHAGSGWPGQSPAVPRRRRMQQVRRPTTCRYGSVGTLTMAELGLAAHVNAIGHAAARSFSIARWRLLTRVRARRARHSASRSAASRPMPWRDRAGSNRRYRPACPARRSVRH